MLVLLRKLILLMNHPTNIPSPPPQRIVRIRDQPLLHIPHTNKHQPRMRGQQHMRSDPIRRLPIPFRICTAYKLFQIRTPRVQGDIRRRWRALCVGPTTRSSNRVMRYRRSSQPRFLNIPTRMTQLELDDLLPVHLEEPSEPRSGIPKVGRQHRKVREQGHVPS